MHGGGVHQIPVVDETGILQVQMIDLFLKRHIPPPIGSDQDEEGQKPCFMVGGLEEFDRLWKGQALKFPGQLSRLGNPDPKKDVTFAVFTRSGFEESPVNLRPFLVAKPLQTDMNFLSFRQNDCLHPLTAHNTCAVLSMFYDYRRYVCRYKKTLYDYCIRSIQSIR